VERNQDTQELVVAEPSPEDAQARVEAAIEAFHARLQENGLKSTRQRDIIAERFFTLDEHISADELLAEVRLTQPRVGYATVYRTLKLLVEQGFAVEKDFGEGYKRYDPVFEQDPHHDHLICVDCHHIIEFNDPDLLERVADIASTLGYTLRRKKLELYAECRNKPDCPNLTTKA
jgi:Fur family ferric uptake transcriptional regulator